MKNKFIYVSIIMVLILLSVAPNGKIVSAESVKINSDDPLSNVYDSAEEGKTTVQDTNEIKSIDGKLLKTINSTVTKEVIKDEETKSVTIIININDIAFDTEGKKIDSTIVTDEIVINDSGEVKINDSEVSSQELASPMENNKISTLASSGGKSYLTYYEDRGVNWYLSAYEKPSNAFLDAGAGQRRIRYPSNMTAGVSNFNALARSVASERNNILSNTGVLLGAIGTGLLTWGTVIGAIGSAGAAGKAAVEIYSSSSSGKSYMKQAFNQLGNL